MRKTQNLFYTLIVIIVFQSCSYSLSKRRYSRGFNLDFGWNRTSIPSIDKKKKNAKLNSEKSEDEIELVPKTNSKLTLKSLKSDIDFKPHSVNSFKLKKEINIQNQILPLKANYTKDSTKIFDLAYYKAKTYTKRAGKWSGIRYLFSIALLGIIPLIDTYFFLSLELSIVISFVLLLILLITIIIYYASIFKAFKNLNTAIKYANTKDIKQKNKLNGTLKKLQKIIYTSIFIYSVLVILSAIAYYSIFVLLPLLLIIPFIRSLSKTKEKFNQKFN